MEYLLLILLVIPIYIVYRLVNTGKKISVKTTVFTTQSRTLQMINHLYEVQREHDYRSLKTQSTDYFDKHHPRIMIVENEGYWIENNAVYRGEFYEDGIDKETVVKLDTMTMSDVELKKLIFIIEQLTKGLDSEDNSKWDEKL
jgi:gamma-glutamylcyclotransferase (GGCT)/AIG2-like uncharacterized protein YtfP